MSKMGNRNEAGRSSIPYGVGTAADRAHLQNFVRALMTKNAKKYDLKKRLTIEQLKHWPGEFTKYEPSSIPSILAIFRAAKEIRLDDPMGPEESALRDKIDADTQHRFLRKYLRLDVLNNPLLNPSELGDRLPARMQKSRGDKSLFGVSCRDIKTKIRSMIVNDISIPILFYWIDSPEFVAEGLDLSTQSLRYAWYRTMLNSTPMLFPWSLEFMVGDQLDLPFVFQAREPTDLGLRSMRKKLYAALYARFMYSLDLVFVYLVAHEVGNPDTPFNSRENGANVTSFLAEVNKINGLRLIDDNDNLPVYGTVGNHVRSFWNMSKAAAVIAGEEPTLENPHQAPIMGEPGAIDGDEPAVPQPGAPPFAGNMGLPPIDHPSVLTLIFNNPSFQRSLEQNPKFISVIQTMAAAGFKSAAGAKTPISGGSVTPRDENGIEQHNQTSPAGPQKGSEGNQQGSGPGGESSSTLARKRASNGSQEGETPTKRGKKGASKPKTAKKGDSTSKQEGNPKLTQKSARFASSSDMETKGRHGADNRQEQNKDEGTFFDSNEDVSQETTTLEGSLILNGGARGGS